MCHRCSPAKRHLPYPQAKWKHACARPHMYRCTRICIGWQTPTHPRLHAITHVTRVLGVNHERIHTSPVPRHPRRTGSRWRCVIHLLFTFCYSRRPTQPRHCTLHEPKCAFTTSRWNAFNSSSTRVFLWNRNAIEYSFTRMMRSRDFIFQKLC